MFLRITRETQGQAHEHLFNQMHLLRDGPSQMQVSDSHVNCYRKQSRVLSSINWTGIVQREQTNAKVLVATVAKHTPEAHSLPQILGTDQGTNVKEIVTQAHVHELQYCHRCLTRLRHKTREAPLGNGTDAVPLMRTTRTWRMPCGKSMGP